MAPRVRAAIFAVRDGRLLMAEHEKGGRRYFLLPGGGVDPGEGWDAAAARELGEELGVTAAVRGLIGVFENRAPDGSRHILHAVFAAEVTGEPAPTGEDDRVVGCRWLTPVELREAAVFPALGARLAAWVEDPPGAVPYARLPWVE